jgi:DNA polymerase III sliding clamp (beta) subunit (PCNA family)
MAPTHDAQIEAHSLREALAAVVPVAGAQTTRPGLRDLVRLDAGPDGVVVTATDTDVTVAVAVSGAGSPAAAAVPGRTLRDIVRFCDGVVTLSFRDDEIGVEGSAGSYRLRSADPSVFDPFLLGVGVPDGAATVVGKDAFPVLRAAVPIVSPDASRGGIAGVRLLSGRVWATDSYRCVNLPLPLGGVPPEGVIIPPLAISAAEQVLGDDEFGFLAEEAAVVFASKTAAVRVRPIVGSYPELDKFFKEADPVASLEVDADALLAACRRVAVVSTDKLTRRVDLSVNEAGLVLKADDPTLGEATTTVPCAVQGTFPLVSVNVTYMATLAEALKVKAGDKPLRMRVTDARKAIVFEIADGDARGLLMPIRA